MEQGHSHLNVGVRQSVSKISLLECSKVSKGYSQALCKLSFLQIVYVIVAWLDLRASQHPVTSGWRNSTCNLCCWPPAVACFLFFVHILNSYNPSWPKSTSSNQKNPSQFRQTQGVIRLVNLIKYIKNIEKCHPLIFKPHQPIMNAIVSCCLTYIDFTIYYYPKLDRGFYFFGKPHVYSSIGNIYCLQVQLWILLQTTTWAFVIRLSAQMFITLGY